MSTKVKLPKGRSAEIDALRGVAVLMVLLFHYTVEFRPLLHHPFDERYDLRIGYLGVHLFFIISGFVIHLTVQRSSSLWSFARRRLLRLFPAFWICLGLSFLVQQWGSSLIGLPAPSWTAGISGLTMLNTLLGIPDVDGVYWSLRVEWTFYALIALVLLTWAKRYAHLAAMLWLAAIAAFHLFGPFYRLGQLLCLPYGGFFLAGICFHRLSTNRSAGMREHVTIALTLLINLQAFAFDLPRAAVILLMYAVFWACTVNAMSFLRWKPLLFLGFVSYPLYLLHRSMGRIIMACFRQQGLPVPFDMILTGLIVIVLAWCVARFAEPYVKRKLDLLLPGSGTSPPADQFSS